MSQQPHNLMPNWFRFFLICEHVTFKPGDTYLTIGVVVNELVAIRNEPHPIQVVVSLFLLPTHEGAGLGLSLWRVGKPGERVLVNRLDPEQLRLPSGKGPRTLALEIEVRIPESGCYWFELADLDGTFGPRGSLLANYLFMATVD